VRQDPPDRGGRTQLVIYFLDIELKPFRLAPAAASFLPRGRKSGTIALRPTQDTDPSRAGGLASSPFDDPGDINGMLSATIDGRSVSVPISLR
jgi:hypothetical protein